MKIDWKKEMSIPRPRMPKWLSLSKRPSLPSRSSKPKVIRSVGKPSIGGSQIKLPKTVTDLYGDLRDRHLLPLVVVLIVAIVAAPIVLSGGGGESEPEVVKPIVTSGQTANSSFSVIPAEQALRSPDRLGHRHAINPFRSEAPSTSGNPGDGESQSESAGGGTPSEPVGDEVTSAGTEATPIESPPTAASESGTGAETPIPAGTQVTQSSTTRTSETESSTEIESTETMKAQAPDLVVSMKTGFTTEELKERTEVPPMMKLPGAQDPALLYIGLSQDQKRALFLMTSTVTAYYGAAHCTLDKEACELIEMKPGTSATFEFGLGEEAKRYKVVLGKIEEATSSQEESAKRTVKKTQIEHPAARGYSISMARRFSK
jgi:hypothetical protein